MLAGLLACTPGAGSPAEAGESAGTGEVGDGDGDGDTEGPGCPDPDVECPDGACVDGSFMPPPYPCCEHGGECPEPSCDPGMPDCPAGEKCNAFGSGDGEGWDGDKCFPVLGDGQPGEPCQAFGEPPGLSGEDDCAAGNLCWNVDPDTGVGYCIAYCVGEWPEVTCPPGTGCGVFNNGVLPLCLFRCDPLLAGADCPGATEVCQPAEGAFYCVVIKEPQVGYAEECFVGRDCAPGLVCQHNALVAGCPGGAQKCCTDVCQLSSPEGDMQCLGYADGMVCAPYQQEPEPGYEDVGYCGLP